jgi:hypothetical protein
LVKELGKFNPDFFGAHKDALLNLLVQSYGVLNEPLQYIVCPAKVPTEFASNEEQRMYQFPIKLSIASSKPFSSIPRYLQIRQKQQSE